MLTPDRIETIIRDALELPEHAELDGSLPPASIPGWDSLAWLRMIAAIEEALGKEIPLEALDDVTTIGEFVSVMTHV